MAFEDNAISSSNWLLHVKIGQLLYIQSDSESPIVIILYVDDLVIGGEHLVDINKVKSLLSDKFEMMDMKEVHYFLGIGVIRTQRHYILNLLYKFGMADCKFVATPSEGIEMDSSLDRRPTPSSWRRVVPGVGALATRVEPP